MCPVGFEPTIEISLVRLKVWWFKPLTYGHLCVLPLGIERAAFEELRESVTTEEVPEGLDTPEVEETEL